MTGNPGRLKRFARNVKLDASKMSKMSVERSRMDNDHSEIRGRSQKSMSITFRNPHTDDEEQPNF